MKNRLTDGDLASAREAVAQRTAEVAHTAGDQFKQLAEKAEQFVIKHPGLAVGVALTAGILLGCLVKRR